MRLYLVQHGKAKKEEEDPERPLTDEGRNEVETVANKAAKLIRPAKILHSPKLRAKQTAEVFASVFNVPAQETEGLKPLDDPNTVKELLDDADLMLVGHLPHMNKLASLLITGNPDSDLIEFRYAAIVCLEKDEKWRLKWILTPELV